MLERLGDQLFERFDETMDATRRKIEPEQLDGDVAIALGIVRAKKRPERTGANLMTNTKGSERVGRIRVSSFRVQ
jgi:hypothetical protein